MKKDILSKSVADVSDPTRQALWYTLLDFAFTHYQAGLLFNAKNAVRAYNEQDQMRFLLWLYIRTGDPAIEAVISQKNMSGANDAIVQSFRKMTTTKVTEKDNKRTKAGVGEKTGKRQSTLAQQEDASLGCHADTAIGAGTTADEGDAAAMMHRNRLLNFLFSRSGPMTIALRKLVRRRNSIFYRKLGSVFQYKCFT
jgi:hypothetical protein